MSNLQRELIKKSRKKCQQKCQQTPLGEGKIELKKI
jgi:hypothetical protein